MDSSGIREIFLRQCGLRLEPNMCEHAMRQMQAASPQAGAAADVTVMGGDARTGIPIRRVIPVQELANSTPLRI